MDCIDWASGECCPQFRIYLAHNNPLEPDCIYAYPASKSYKYKKDEKIVLEVDKSTSGYPTLFGDVKIEMEH